MGEALLPEAVAAGAEQLDVQVVLHPRGIGILPPPGLQVTPGIAGVGIAGRQDDLPRRGNAENAGVAPAAAGFQRLQAHQQARHLSLFVQVEENAHVIGPAALVADVQEMGIVGDRHAVGDGGVELRGRIARIVELVEHPHGHQVFPVAAGEVIVGDPALDGLLRALEMRQRRQDHIIGNLRLDAPQAQLHRDVPVEGKPVRKQFEAVLLLAEAQHAGRHDQVHRHQDGIDHAARQREGVEGTPGPFRHERPRQLQQERHAEQHRDERQVHHDAERRELREFVDFQREAGIERDAAQRRLRIGQDGQHGGRDAPPDDAAPARRVRPGPDVGADHIGAARDHQDGDVDQDDRAQRVQHLAAGIEHRREDQHPAPGVFPPEIQSRHDRQDAGRHEVEAAPGTLRRQVQEEGGQDQEERQPEQRGGVPAHRQRLAQDLELRPSLHRHGGSAAGGQRTDGIPAGQAQPRVHPGSPAHRQVVHHLHAGDHAHGGVAVRLQQVPVRAHAHETDGVFRLQQRGFRAHAGIRQERYVHALVDVVVRDREGVAPGLERIPAVAVNHHIAGKPLQCHPLGGILRERLPGIGIQQGHAAVQHALHAPGRPGGVPGRQRHPERGDEQHRADDEKRRGDPFPDVLAQFHS